MSMRKKVKNVVVIATISSLIVGCMTMRTSRLPYFIENLEKHSFTLEQRETIGEILRYVNDLEN